MWPVRWRCLAAWVSVIPEPHGRKTEKIPTSCPIIIRVLWHIKICMIFYSKLEKQSRTNGRNFNLFSITNTLSHLSQLSISSLKKTTKMCHKSKFSVVKKMSKLNNFFLFKFQQYSLSKFLAGKTSYLLGIFKTELYNVSWNTSF